MLFGTKLTRMALREPPFVLVVVQQKEVARSRFVAGDHSSCVIFCFDIHFRGQPKTPPSVDDLAVLDYHLKELSHSLFLFRNVDYNYFTTIILNVFF